MFTAAAAPETTQLNCVWRARPMPIATHGVAGVRRAANASSGDRVGGAVELRVGASSSTSHGASTPSASEIHAQTKSR